MMFGLRSDFDMKFTLEDFENMIVFERDIYFILIESRMKEIKNQVGKN